MFNFILFTIILVLIGIYGFFKNRSMYWKRRGVPYIEPEFPLGNFRDLGTKFDHTQFFQNFYNEFKGKSLFAGLFSLLLEPVILITDTKLIKNILIKDFNYFVNRVFYSNEKDDPLSAHLLALEDDKWRNTRIKLTPAFTSAKMKLMFPTIVSVANELKNCVSKKLSFSEEIDLHDIFARFTTDVIGICAFGIECNSLNDPKAKFREMGRKAVNSPRISTLKLFLAGEFPRLSNFLKVKVFHDDVTDFFLNAVRETVQYREENKIERNDFMSLLIQLKQTVNNANGFTIEEIAAQAFLFFLAGFETSSSTMAFTIYELALNLDVQEKARTEINQVLKKHNGVFSYEALCEMKYLEMVIDESLRKYPTAGLLIRKATSNYKIPDSNLIIEKGRQIFIPIYAIHNDPDFYPNPEVFDPERFSEETIKNRKDYCYFPFGDGPRSCIGLRFGLMQTRIGIATLLYNFKFTKTSKIEIPIKLLNKSLVMAPENNISITVERV